MKWLVGAGIAGVVAIAVAVTLTVLPDGNDPDGSDAPAICGLASPAEGVSPLPAGSLAPELGFDPTPGWEMYEDSSGFRIALPSDWDRLGTGTCFGHRGEGRYAGVSQWRPNGTDLAAYWRAKERQISGTLTGYRNVAIRGSATRAGGVEWEFTYTDGGTPMRAIAFAFIASSQQSSQQSGQQSSQRGYGYFAASKESIWQNTFVVDYSQLHATFQPAI
jgi:hypothetical protein